MQSSSKTRVSFDYDGTLGHKPHLQRLAQEMCKDPHNEVHIITRRYDYVHPKYGDERSDVFKMARALRIPQERVHFLNRAYKIEKIKELEINIHWDDDVKEIALIRRDYPSCIGLLTI